MKFLIEAAAQLIVDQPDKVRINEIESPHTIVFELSVDKNDLGKIIGAKGRNISAIRTIMSALAGKIKKRIIVEIVE